MDKLTFVSGALFLLANIFALTSLILPDWIVSDVGGDTRLGLLQSCVNIHMRQTSHCYTPILPPDWSIALVCIVLGCVSNTLTIVLLVLSHWNIGLIPHARWMGFSTMVLYCLAAVIFPMGFTMPEIGGEPYQLPSSHQVGISYIFFVLALWITVISELFAGRVCLPRF